MSKKPNRRSLLLTLIALLIALSPFVVPRGNAQASQPDGLERQALEEIAARTGRTTAQLQIANATIASYPLQGRTASAFKVEDVQTGEMYGIMLDSNGQELDPEQLAAAERDAYRARYGNFEPALAEQLKTAARNEVIPVVIWLKEAERELPLRPLPGDAALANKVAIDTLLAEVRVQRAEAVREVVEPVAARLQGLGVRVTTNGLVPVISASLTAETVQKVSGWSEVDMIYLDGTNETEMDVSRMATGAAHVEFVGFNGTGERVAQVEVGGRVAVANPFLSGITQDATSVCSSNSGHSTGVAGIIRSTDWTQRGIAPSVALWAGGSCNGLLTELQTASTAAANWGATALNLSWGSDTNLVVGVRERFYDDYVFNNWLTVVKSAGNRGLGDGDVTSPGLAYNILTVGNYDHHDTNSWADDTMATDSSFRDPISTHGDREKPEIAAPGTGIQSTITGSPWLGNIGSGTSFAAPQVTGGAALLMQVDPELRVWPEGVKAIMMAGALNNIEGGSRLSDVDGAGGIDLFAAFKMADDSSASLNADWGGFSYSCGGTQLMDVATITLTAGQRTRVAIAWPTNDDFADYVNRPDTDLDLRIYAPNGSWLASSASNDNTYEIVEFTPTTSGVYTLRVNKFRCDTGAEQRWLGYAWHQGESILGLQ